MSISYTDALGNWYKIRSSVTGSITGGLLVPYRFYQPPESQCDTDSSHKRLISVNSVVSVSWKGGTGYEYDILAGATASETGGDGQEIDTIHPSETISETGEDRHLDYMVAIQLNRKLMGITSSFLFYERAAVSETGDDGNTIIAYQTLVAVSATPGGILWATNI